MVDLDANEIEEVILTTIFGILYVTGVPLLIWRCKKEPIRSRGWVLALLQITYCWFDMGLSISSGAPCFVDNLDTVSTLILWIYPYFIRYCGAITPPFV